MKKNEQCETITNMKSELSFLMEFNLNRRGMLKEIETEFNIIKVCYKLSCELGVEHSPMINRILVMPLRKLLCEKNSVLLKLIDDLKLPPLMGTEIGLNDKLKIIMPNFTIVAQDKWIPVEDWLNQNIAWIDKTVSDLPDVFLEDMFKSILNKLKKENKTFESLFEKKEIIYKGDLLTIYTRIDPNNSENNNTIFSILKEIGYYDLSIYNFLKHLSDKRGAHIDTGISPIIEMINEPVIENMTPIFCIAIQVIWAVKQQVPELANYWPEMNAILEEFICGDR